MSMTITPRPSSPFVGPYRRHRAPTAPNYALRRLVVSTAALALAVPGVTALAATLASVGGTPAAASDAAAASSAVVSPAIHVARPGDTLWSIARDHRGEVDHDRYVEALIDLNGGTTIAIGQAVLLP